MNAPTQDPPPRVLLAALAVTVTPPAVLGALMLGTSAVGIALDRGTCAVLAVLAGTCGLALALALWRTTPPVARTPSTDPRTPLERGLLGAIAIAAVLGTVLALLTLVFVARDRPVIDWDGLYYHVPAMHGWARAGRIVWIEGVPDVPFVNGYPMALEALGLWSVQVFGHDRWIDATNLLCWPAGACGLALTAHRLGARGAWLPIAGAAVAGIPAVLASSATAYVDAGFFCASAVAFGLTLWRLQGGRSIAVALLWGASLGLLMAVKGTGIPLAFLLVLAVGIRALALPNAERSHALRTALVGAAIALAIGGGWPLRAFVHTGNPLHPIQLRLGAKVLAEGYDAHRAADLAMPADLRRLPAPLRAPATWLRPFTPITRYDQTEGLGPLWTLAGWPALVALAGLALRRRDAALSTWLAVAALWWVAQPASWWARFSLWILALGAPAAIAWLARAQRSPRRAPRAAALAGALLLTALGAQVSVQTLDHQRNWRVGGAIVAGSESALPDAIDTWWPRLREHEGFRQALSAERIARTPVDRVGTLFAGALAQPVGRREIVVVNADDTIAAAMRERAVRWLVWDEVAAGEPSAATLQELAEIDRFDLGGSSIRLLLLR